MSCCSHSTKAFSTSSTNTAKAGTSPTPPLDATPAAQKAVEAGGGATNNNNQNKGVGRLPPPGSLYRRPLPDSCIALSSQEGQKRFKSALESGGLKSFFPLIEQFTTQSEPAFCGISTLVIILNALAVDPKRTWRGPWRWYSESLLNCGLNMEDVKRTGITISEFRCLAICQGLAVKVVRADDEEEEEQQDGDDENEGQIDGLQRFRQAVQKACVKQEEDSEEQQQQQQDPPVDELLVVSYARKVLGQTGSGHFSPIAAYDPKSDSVLVLDTARFKYGAHWVSLPLMFDAMKPIDPDTGRSRGYILLCDHDSKEQHYSSSSSHLIPSLLFRSQRKTNPIRKEYKNFLATIDEDNKTNSSLDFDTVAAFWTRNNTNPKEIWKMMEPQFTPMAGEETVANLIAQVRGLIKRLLLQLEHQPLPPECCQCRVNFARTLDISPREAIFVVYLASLEEDKRKEIVLGVQQEGENNSSTSNGEETTEEAKTTTSTTTAQTQLLAEAELVRHALDMCDVVDTR